MKQLTESLAKPKFAHFLYRKYIQVYKSMAGAFQLYEPKLLHWIPKILAFCKDSTAAAHYLVLSRHCTVTTSTIFPEMC